MAFGQVGIFMERFGQIAFNIFELVKFDVENALVDC